MKVTITLEVDATDDHCEAVLSELETSLAENEGITVKTGGGFFEAALVAVTEVPAIGRPPRDLHQLTIFDALNGGDNG